MAEDFSILKDFTMYFFLLFTFLGLGHQLHAAQDLVHSASGSIVLLSSNSELQNKDQKKGFTFEPNVASGRGLAVETKYVTIGYIFSGDQVQNENYTKSNFNDFRFNFYFNHFDVRLNYQYYKGALVDAGGLKKYYDEYEVRGRNGRAHYYFNKEILKYVRDGRELTRKAVRNEGFNHIGSWILGFNVDSRTITLPSTLASEHQDVLNRKDILYHPSFNALTFGPLFGYDYFAQWSSLYIRGKIGAGPGFQTKGGIAEQTEIAFALGVAFKIRHSLTLGVDTYIMTFKDENEVIRNNNSQGSLVYNYAFE